MKKLQGTIVYKRLVPSRLVGSTFVAWAELPLPGAIHIHARDSETGAVYTPIKWSGRYNFQISQLGELLESH